MNFGFAKIFSYCVFISFILYANGALFAKDARMLEWGDLAPEGYFESLEKKQESILGGIFDGLEFGSEEEEDESQEAIIAYEQMQMELRSAPIVQELDGEYVRIPGFIVPLEFDFENGTFSEFLLAPYFGACIHVPPPPSNQIVYVKPDGELKQRWLEDAVWVMGTMTTDSVDSEYGFAGYSMNNIQLEVYDGE